MATRHEYFTPVSYTNYNSGYGVSKCQTFTAESTHSVDQIKLKLKKLYGCDHVLYGVYLYAADGSHLPTGGSLAQFGSFYADELTTSYVTYTFEDTTYDITNGIEYAIVVYTSAEILVNIVYWPTNTENGYATGSSGVHTYLVGWSVYSANDDRWFEIYSTDVPSAPKNPTPTHEATGITLDDTIVTWEDGGGGETYDVYFRPTGEFFEKIASDITDTFIDAIVAHTVAYNGHYTYGELYLWCVIAKNEYGSNYAPPTDFGIGYGGTIWQFNAMVFDPPLPSGVTLSYAGDDDGIPTGTPTGENFMTAIRGLVAAANDRIWYEDI